MSRQLAVLVVVAVAFGGGGTAQAAPEHHSGLEGGLSIGGGGFTFFCDDCQGNDFGGNAYGGHIGYWLSPRLALEYDGWITTHRFVFVGATASLHAHTLAAEFWPLKWLWVKGGLGYGRMTFTYQGDIESTDHAGAAIAAVGAEFARYRNVGFDFHVNYMLARSNDVTALMVAGFLGLNFD